MLSMWPKYAPLKPGIIFSSSLKTLAQIYSFGQAENIYLDRSSKS